MNKVENIPSFYVIGLSAQTSNLKEMSPESAQIGKLWDDFFAQNIIADIPNIKDKDRLYGVYHAYKINDEDIHYTLTIGVKVEHLDNIPEGLTALEIPAQTYTVFNTATGPVEDVLLETWKKIWKSDVDALGGERAFAYDFECYLESDISDPNNAKATICIGIQ